MTTKQRTSTANKHGSSWIRKDKRVAIYLRDGYLCVYCQQCVRNVEPEARTLDHVNARHEAGFHHEGNLVTACRSCNSSRQDEALRTWASPDAVARVRRQTRRVLRPYRLLAKQLLAAGTQAGD